MPWPTTRVRDADRRPPTTVRILLGPGTAPPRSKPSLGRGEGDLRTLDRFPRNRGIGSSKVGGCMVYLGY